METVDQLLQGILPHLLQRDLSTSTRGSLVEHRAVVREAVSISAWVGAEKGVRLAWELVSRSRITLHFGAKAVKTKKKIIKTSLCLQQEPYSGIFISVTRGCP